MTEQLWSFMKQIARGLLPYPDPVRRRRVRKAARSLAGRGPLPPTDQQTGPDVARVALKRLLHLQRDSRKVSRRSLEATVLLARSAIETCILGLYCLQKENVVADLQGASIRSARNIMQYLVTDSILSTELFEQSLGALDGEERRHTWISKMAEAVDAASETPVALDLYRRFYGPASELFAHANAASLSRYVNGDDEFTEKPMFPWTRRSALHITDACVGILAMGLASDAGEIVKEFSLYAIAHGDRVLTPLAVVAGRGVGGLFGITKLIPLMRRVRVLDQYVQSGQALVETPETRATHIRELVGDLLAHLPISGLPDEVIGVWREELVTTLVAHIIAKASG